jgi:hypothetical protein
MDLLEEGVKPSILSVVSNERPKRKDRRGIILGSEQVVGFEQS